MIKLEKMYHKYDNDDYTLYETVDATNTPLCNICKELAKGMLLRYPYSELIDTRLIKLYSKNDTSVTLSQWGTYKKRSTIRSMVKVYSKEYIISDLPNHPTQGKAMGVYNILVELEKLGIVAYELDILIKEGKVETIRVISDSKDCIR